MLLCFIAAIGTLTRHRCRERANEESREVRGGQEDKESAQEPRKHVMKWLSYIGIRGCWKPILALQRFRVKVLVSISVRSHRYSVRLALDLHSSLLLMIE